MDMLDMPFSEETFDMVIANHVLEHVNDADKALAEIRRVLKRDGHAILQTPYSSKLHKTWSDPGIDTPEARLQGCKPTARKITCGCSAATFLRDLPLRVSNRKSANTTTFWTNTAQPDMA